MNTYLVQLTTALDEQGQTVYTATLVVPGLSTDELLSLLEVARVRGEIPLEVKTLRV